jgi:hypothetical protein
MSDLIPNAGSVQHIDELFVLEDTDFIKTAFEVLLGRVADDQGLRYYRGRLALGVDKAEILADLAKSPEAVKPWKVKGVERLLREQQRRAFWSFPWRINQRQSENTARQTRYSQVIFMRQLAERLSDTSAAILLDLQDSQEKWNNIMLREASTSPSPQTIQKLVERLSDTSAAILLALQDSQEKWNNITLREASTSPSPQTIQKQLPDNLIRQSYLEVLGREPESQQVVDHHAMFENTAMLKKALMNSDEFRTKLAGLPEPARIVYQQYLLVRGAH